MRQGGDKLRKLFLSILEDLEKRFPQSREAVEKLLEDDTLFDDAFETLETTYRAIGLNLELGGL